MVTNIFKVYGRENHRLRSSFFKSVKFTDANGAKIQILNADITGTNDYSIMIVTASTWENCKKAAQGQYTDGYFEDDRTGALEDIDFLLENWDK